MFTIGLNYHDDCVYSIMEIINTSDKQNTNSVNVTSQFEGRYVTTVMCL